MSGFRPHIQGENHPRWKGGVSPYPREFNYQLKEKIRDRDNRICQLCDKTEGQNHRRLDVHHIDYDKRNSNPKNLITLCHTCNNEVECGKGIWKRVFKRRIKNIYKQIRLMEKERDEDS